MTWGGPSRRSRRAVKNYEAAIAARRARAQAEIDHRWDRLLWDVNFDQGLRQLLNQED